MERFLVRTYVPRNFKRSPYVVAEEIAVMHPAIFRKAGPQHTVGGLPINRLEATGRVDSKRFDIVVRKGTTARGVESSRSRDRAVAPATAAGVKKVIRVLRDQEAEKLDAIDERIEDLERQVDEARRERVEIVREAWAKGNVVRLAEMEERAEEYAAEIARRKEEKG